MSYEEYEDLFIKAQSKGIYHMFVFDIEKSRQMSTDKRFEAFEKSEKLMMSIYEKIQEIEKTTNSKILVFEEGFIKYSQFTRFTELKEFGMKVEPVIIGDSFAFTIYRDTLSRDKVKEIFEHYYNELNIDFNFHTADAFYETNDYAPGNTKYFRGHCLQKLCDLHKTKSSKILKK